MGVDYIADAGRKAKGKRPQFFESTESERLMAILMAVVEELATDCRLAVAWAALHQAGPESRRAG